MSVKLKCHLEFTEDSIKENHFQITKTDNDEYLRKQGKNKNVLEIAIKSNINIMSQTKF